MKSASADQSLDVARVIDSAANVAGRHDVYFSADIETDGPIPGPFSMLSFALVPAGRFDGCVFSPVADYNRNFYTELRPISQEFEVEALRVNGLDRSRLMEHGKDPVLAMAEASAFVREVAGSGVPILVAYPLSFDWSWLYWYFIRFCGASPFGHSQCFDIKTAIAVKNAWPIARSGRSNLPRNLKSSKPHTHNALDDAIEQAEIFARTFSG